MNKQRLWTAVSWPLFDRKGPVVVFLLALSVVTRLAAFPASIWDQDEAYFAAGVLHFDPLHNQPHPPFFPLWIAIGKAFHHLWPATAPELGLQLASLLAAIALPIVLWVLWSKVLDPALAAAAALLFTILPGPWLLAGRAYTGTAATLFLAVGAIFLLDCKASFFRTLAGSLALSLSFLIRPQWIPVIALICLWALWKLRGPSRVVPGGVALALGGIALAVMARSAGGLSSLVAAVRSHGQFQFGALSGFTFAYSDLGVHKALGGAFLGSAWILLTLVGLVSVVKLRDPGARWVVWLLLTPQLVLYLFAENPTLPRYAIPLLAFSAGLAVEGMRVILRSAPRATIGTLVIALISTAAVAPHLGLYRRQPSPIVRMFQRLGDADMVHSIVVADHTLASFIQLDRLEGRWQHRMLWDYAIEGGLFRSRPRPDLVAVWDGDRPPYVRGGTEEGFSCEDAFLAPVVSPRFIRLKLCSGCGVAPAPTGEW